MTRYLIPIFCLALVSLGTQANTQRLTTQQQQLENGIPSQQRLQQQMQQN
ncbi:hypothetical protein [Candidatus Symbiopectobacterium sp. PLON1]|nr:hypothetical protein [Candidatus Symbiopectobacterium sp. PLON1]